MTEETTPKTYTQEEYNELQQQGEKGVEILKERYNYILTNREELLSDPNKVKEVMGEDKKLGKLILDQLYEGKELDDILVKEEVKEQPDIDAIVAQKLEQAKVQDKVDSVVQKLPEDKREEFLKEFNDLTEGKKLNPKSVSKYLKYSLDGVLGDTDLDVSGIKAQAFGSGVGPGKTKNIKEKKKQSRIDYAKKLRQGG